jgi:hypothetical protein
MESDSKGVVSWRSWCETYTELVDPPYKEGLTREMCVYGTPLVGQYTHRKNGTTAIDFVDYGIHELEKIPNWIHKNLPSGMLSTLLSFVSSKHETTPCLVFAKQRDLQSMKFSRWDVPYFLV